LTAWRRRNSAHLTTPRKSLLLQLLHERLSELLHLRFDDEVAVRLIRVATEILLVIVLGHPEVRCRRDFRDDRIGPHLGLAEPFDDLLGDFFLLFRVMKDHGAVLRTDVVALAVER